MQLLMTLLLHPAENLKSFDTIPGPTGLPFIGSLLSLAAFRPKAHLLWSEWAAKYGAIYKYRLRYLDQSHVSSAPLCTQGHACDSMHACGLLLLSRDQRRLPALADAYLAGCKRPI